MADTLEFTTDRLTDSAKNRHIRAVVQSARRFLALLLSIDFSHSLFSPCYFPLRQSRSLSPIRPLAPRPLSLRLRLPRQLVSPKLEERRRKLKERRRVLLLRPSLFPFSILHSLFSIFYFPLFSHLYPICNISCATILLERRCTYLNRRKYDSSEGAEKQLHYKDLPA
jgi:hypothetical protein